MLFLPACPFACREERKKSEAIKLARQTANLASTRSELVDLGEDTQAEVARALELRRQYEATKLACQTAIGSERMYHGVTQHTPMQGPTAAIRLAAPPFASQPPPPPSMADQLARQAAAVQAHQAVLSLAGAPGPFNGHFLQSVAVPFLNGYPHYSSLSGSLHLYFVPYARQWRISDRIEHAGVRVHTSS